MLNRPLTAPRPASTPWHCAALPLTATILTLGLLTLPSTAAAAGTFRLQGQLVATSASTAGLTEDFGSGPGAYIGLEIDINDRLGIELGASWLELEASERQEFFGFVTDLTASITATPVTLALNLHLTPQKRYDVYLAPKIGWAFYDDFELVTRVDGSFNFPGLPIFPTLTIDGETVVTDLATEDQFLFGLRLGVDVPFGQSAWSFSSSLDYTDLPLEFDFVEGADLGIDPLSIGVGIAYGF
ncbi:MAG: outer membrane beta-barrel protein [Acidobacteriota bacterium]